MGHIHSQDRNEHISSMVDLGKRLCRIYRVVMGVLLCALGTSFLVQADNLKFKGPVGKGVPNVQIKNAQKVDLKKLGGVKLSPIAQSPALITKIYPQTAAVTSDKQGRAKVVFKVVGQGNGACTGEVRVDRTLYGAVMFAAGFEIKPGSGFPKEVSIPIDFPGTYTAVAVGRSSSSKKKACKGKPPPATVTVNPHAEFPCSLYSGFKKFQTVGGWLCVPANVTPAAIGTQKGKKYDKLCQPNRKFYNDRSGYVFGCFFQIPGGP